MRFPPIRPTVLLLLALLAGGCGGLSPLRTRPVDPLETGLVRGPLQPSPLATRETGTYGAVRVDREGNRLPLDDAPPEAIHPGWIGPPPEVLPVGAPLDAHRPAVLEWVRSRDLAGLVVCRVEPEPSGLLPGSAPLVSRVEPSTPAWVPLADDLDPLVGGFRSAFRLFHPLTVDVYEYGLRLDRAAAGYSGLLVGSSAGGLGGTVYLFAAGDGFDDPAAPYASIAGAAGGGLGLSLVLWAHDWIILMPGAAVADGSVGLALGLWDGGHLIGRGLADAGRYGAVGFVDGLHLLGRLLRDGALYAGAGAADLVWRPLRVVVPWPAEGEMTATVVALDPHGRLHGASRAAVRVEAGGPPAWRDGPEAGREGATEAIRRALDTALGR